MKRKVILCTVAILTLCFSTGCQKLKAENIPLESESTNGIEVNNETAGGSKSGDTESASSEPGVSSGLNLSLDENRIIQDQSFQVELNDWGDVRFVSYGPGAGSDFEDVSFYLTKDNKVVFSFPYYGENNKTDQYAGLFDSVESVAFRDVNGDKLKDVIVIINYISGAGPQGMEARPKARIFQADKKDFILAKDLTDDVNDHIEEKDMSIDHIYEYLKNK
ncbi:hypothetical protein RZO55_00425 [Clostridium boliviensis]|uniref:VCBS repeat-containing protein n=1 Tax=Clostridium boliviensis TaxID=318465 RepID=A0ABU4GGH1_9CLOT|nr:hypothetical protein [Clostridium boliviensis]MDW2796050.1 hypothetical protein [Clostridium boliviensis]